MRKFYVILIAGLALTLGACSKIVGAPLEQGDYDATITVRDSDNNEETYDFTFTVNGDGEIDEDSYNFDYEGVFVDIDVSSSTGNNRLRIDATMEYDFFGTDVVHALNVRGTTRGNSADGTANYTRSEDGDTVYQAKGTFQAHLR